MDNTSSIYVPHGSCYEDSSVFQYQKTNYESYHSKKLNKYKANNIRNTIFHIVIRIFLNLYVIDNKKLYDVSIIYILYY